MTTTQTAKNEVITENDAIILRQLAGLYKKEDTGGGADMLPILKINYDPESIHPTGAWVVGQKKGQEGEIVEEGQLAKGLIAVIIRKRYSFYVQKDPNKNCSSPIFVDSDPVYGSKYGHNCKSGTCPHRAKDADPRCKAQWVVFGLALTDAGKLVDCMAYIQGTSYMPFDEFRTQITRAKLDSGFLQVPPFSYIIKLGSKKLKNGGTTYYQIDFKKGRMLSGADEVKVCTDRQEKFGQLISALNSKVTGTTNIQVSQPAAPAEAQQAFSGMAAKPSEPDDIDDSVIDAEWDTVSDKLNAKPDQPEAPDVDMEFDGGVDDDIDIEEAVQKAILGKT